ncbi:hypothetical protein FHX42_005112 [Saccharopolyspora lacisalsi]|uniref:HEAT repeat domain-containing protein n=1 Tax=Halosaccharopolyspora lacisalsi TaxID=1000566 RepID=A0A839E7N1_9PSEU|nr:hypothetical protein [Halosaccharopolyspora lacisalsi]MBA8827707.1 hypothetical protein [Halosaccharopolyspora lacisalsi]
MDAVQRAVFLRRGDLFRSAVAGAGAGKFLFEGDSRTPVWSEGVRRLAPADQRLHADRLAEVVSDEGERTHQRVAALHAVARIPGTGREVVARWTDSEDVSLAEAALGALAWTDEPESALPTLLAHRSDERARVAMTAAARCARSVRPSELAESLRRALPTAAKVNARKQLLHTCALLPPETAMEVVHTVWQRPEEHRDVRASCVRVALRMPGATHAWSILRESTGTEREVTKPLFALRPVDIAERCRLGYADLLLAAVERADPRTSQEAAHALPQWSAFNDGVVRWLVETTTDLDRRDWARAMSALVRLVASGEQQPAMETTVRSLAAAVNDESRDADAERDVPARQRLHALVREWGSSALRVSVSPRPVLVRGGRVLVESDPTLLPLAVEVLVRQVRTRDPAQTPDDLHEIARLLHGRPGLAATTSQQLSGIAGRVDDPGGLLPGAEGLATSGTPVEGSFAVALCAGAAPRLRWPRQWRALISRLRAHPDREVAEAALSVFTTREYP